MILRRFSKHFSEQNWFAVGLDLMVVITGIFLGLQVSNWNEIRKERLEEQVYLNRLIGEITETRDANTEVVEEAREKLGLIGKASTLLLAGTLTENNMHDFQEYIFAMHYYPKAIIYDSAINEMVASGKVGLIQNADIRSMIVTYAESVEDARNFNSGHFSEFLKLRRAIHAQLKLPLDYDKSHRILDRPEDILKNRGLLGTVRFTHELLGEQVQGIDNFRNNASSMLIKLNKYQQ